MRTLLTMSLVFAALGLPVLGWAQQPSAPQGAPPPPPAVKIGETAPEFTLTYLAPGAEGKVDRKDVKLSDFKGKQNVVLAFFPAAFSPG